MKPGIIKIVIISSMALLIACGKVPETRYFTIEFSKLAKQTEHIGPLLHIQPFDASSVLKFDKLMYKTSPYEIRYDAYRRWATTPSTLLAEKAVEYFAESQLFDRVITETLSIKDGYSLFGYVSHFEESFIDGKRVALVDVSFDVSDIAERKLLLHKRIVKTEPIREESIEGIMSAMSQAVTQVFDELAAELVRLAK